jgi:hypothetical protein
LEVSLALTEAQLLGEQPIDEPLPVGRTLVRALENRISGLPDDARRALLVAAASGAESVQPVVDALGALGLDRGPRRRRAGRRAVAGGRASRSLPLAPRSTSCKRFRRGRRTSASPGRQAT